MQPSEPMQKIPFGSSSTNPTKHSRLLRYIMSPRGVIITISCVAVLIGVVVFVAKLQVSNSSQSGMQTPSSLPSDTTSKTDTNSGASTAPVVAPKTPLSVKTNKTPSTVVPGATAAPSGTTTSTSPNQLVVSSPVISSGYPSASSTGSRGTLTTISGDVLLNTDGQIFENARIRGRLTVDANSVTIRNVEVINNDYWVVLNYGLNMTIEDSTLIGGNNTQASVGDANSGYFTGRRLNISGAADGLKMGAGSKIYSSYIHDLATFDGAHNDSIEVNGPDVTISGNTILNQNSQTSAVFNMGSNVVIDGNFLAGGGYTIYGGSGDGATNVRVTNNVLSTIFFAGSGFYGPSAYWPSGSTWTNNKWYDGPNKGMQVSG